MFCFVLVIFLQWVHFVHLIALFLDLFCSFFAVARSVFMFLFRYVLGIADLDSLLTCACTNV